MLQTPCLCASQFSRANSVVYESAKVLPVEIRARPRNFLSMGLTSVILGDVTVGGTATLIMGAPVRSRLPGLSGSSAALETAARAITANAERTIDFRRVFPCSELFMMTSFVGLF